MIRVTVSYALNDSSRFDFAYYCDKHAALVHSLCDPIGLKSFQIDRDEQAKVVTAHLLFEPRATFMADLTAASPVLMADAVNYTDVHATTAFSTVIHQS